MHSVKRGTQGKLSQHVTDVHSHKESVKVVWFSVSSQCMTLFQMAFLDKRGLHHPSPKVRSRCSYLFSRIVKSLK